MKRIIAILLAFAFVASLALETFAQRDPAEELAAVRGYLKTLDVKIIKYKGMRGAKAAATLKGLRAQKVATLKRLAILKAQAEAAVAPPPPSMAPVPPPPVVVTPAPAAKAGILGLGWNTNWTGTYLNTGHGKISGALGARVDLVIDDMWGLGSMVGLSADSLKWCIGMGGLYGVDSYNNTIKAIPLFLGATLDLPASMFVGGNVNYTLYGTGRTSGPYGVEAFVGYKRDFGLGLGKTAVQIGWSAIRAGGSPAIVSAKGLTLSVGQALVL